MHNGSLCCNKLQMSNLKFATTPFYVEGCIMFKLDVMGGLVCKYLSPYLHINKHQKQ